MVTLVGDVATNYFLLRELDLQLEIARQTLQINNTTVDYFQNRLSGGVSNRLELDRIRPCASRPPWRFRKSSARLRKWNIWSQLLLGRPPGPVTRDRLTLAEQSPPPIPPGLPTSLLERRPDVMEAEQILVAANADIGVAKSLFYPSISLTSFFGGVSGDLTSFLAAPAACGRWARRCSSRSSWRDESNEISKPPPPDSMPRSPSIRRRRSTAIAKSPTR
jgi:multidrug efflux system outer membrane protein